MEHSSPHSMATPATRPPETAACKPVLAVVPSCFRLAQPQGLAPAAWAEGLAEVLGWLGVAAEFGPPAPAPSPTRRLPRMADWRGPATGAADPVFAPWIGWSPAAFQHGGCASLPQADYAVSYLLGHARGGPVGGAGGAAAGRGGADLMLLSPHPATCTAPEAGDAPAPRASVLRAMIAAARGEGRARIAIILHARQRNAVARQLLAAGKETTREPLAITVLTIEEALPTLAVGAPVWDAVIAMPDLRSTVFTLIAHTSGLSRAWPMLWFAGDTSLRHVTSEAAGAGAGASCLALDAPALIHALTLTLHHAGITRAAWRLHEGWARLRDSGVTTAGHGSDGPYARVVDDGAFITMLVQGAAASKRAQQPWRALKNAENANVGSHLRHLRVVTSTLASPTYRKGR